MKRVFLVFTNNAFHGKQINQQDGIFQKQHIHTMYSKKKIVKFYLHRQMVKIKFIPSNQLKNPNDKKEEKHHCKLYFFIN